MVVPFGEGDYYQARPSIAIARPGSGDGAALDLDGFFGFNPRLQPLKPFWDARQLAIVHACGSPDTTRSHFDAQDYMETATPGVKSTADGWLNRYLQARRVEEATPFRAVALSGQVPRMLQGPSPALAMSQIDQFGIRAGQATETVERVVRGALRRGGRPCAERHRARGVRRDQDAEDERPARYEPEHGADYPRSAFGQALKQIAQLIKANVGLEVAFADVGGWDTHINQGAAQGQLATRLDDFSRGIAALVTDLGDRMADTVVLTMSEFGRAVSENGNRGTDHGHGNAMMVIGGGVRGGRVLRQVARAGARAALRRTRPRGHDRFPRRVRRDRRAPPRRAGPEADLPGLQRQPTRFPGLFA